MCDDTFIYEKAEPIGFLRDGELTVQIDRVYEYPDGRLMAIEATIRWPGYENTVTLWAADDEAR